MRRNDTLSLSVLAQSSGLKFPQLPPCRVAFAFLTHFRQSPRCIPSGFEVSLTLDHLALDIAANAGDARPSALEATRSEWRTEHKVNIPVWIHVDLSRQRRRRHFLYFLVFPSK